MRSSYGYLLLYGSLLLGQFLLQLSGYYNSDRQSCILLYVVATMLLISMLYFHGNRKSVEYTLLNLVLFACGTMQYCVLFASIFASAASKSLLELIMYGPVPLTCPALILVLVCDRNCIFSVQAQGGTEHGIDYRFFKYCYTATYAATAAWSVALLLALPH